MSQGHTYGRIPGQTVELFGKLIADVRELIDNAIPSTAGEKVKDWTLEQTLEIVLQDWRENDNTSGLTDADKQDLASFITMSAAMAGSDLQTSGFAVYQSVFKGLLEDWLENWNADGQDGPPLLK